jgi:calcium-dependent protein kinase
MTKEEIAAFQDEMNILRQLDHPNILKLHEVFEDNRKFFLVTEFCDGCELFDEISNHHHFNEKQAASYIEQIVRAVVYCHSMGIVHRDLKPENILIDAEQDGIVKLIDFGTSVTYQRGSDVL